MYKKTKLLLVVLALLIFPTVGIAATNDFVANSNITVSGVTFGSITADMLILSGSTAESWLFNSGAFSATNPGSAFQVGSSDSAVKSIQVSQSGSTLVCSENTIPGTSYATLPTASGTYTISPSATTACTSLCTALSNTASYNAFPTCGALSCSAGYQISGSGAGATCVANPGGVAMLPACGAGYKLSATLSCVPITVSNVNMIPGCMPGYKFSTTTGQSCGTSGTVAPSDGSRDGILSAVFIKNLSFRMSSDDVRRLQALLASDKEVYPEGLATGYYGALTKKAVGKFQIKHGVVSSSEAPGYGMVGPLTRAKLLVVFGK
ncbi:MAG: peptidoglycan-binding domain-containing protein [Patescibacteria group bacterium]